jgi:hypothetical protein|tara:strand:+ start:3996 stop:4166 length:171 start_codon:yes stop_codon:yes gene_type:complete
MNELIEMLKHHYEVDIHNCAMTHEEWIKELAKAMLDKSYKDKFLADYKDYKEFLNQ